MTANVDGAHLAEALAALGIRAGDRLEAHSSLSSFGRIDGGAMAVIGALVDTVGTGGLVAMPCFTYGRAPFDPSATPTIDGAVPEAFRTHPGTLRSDHPTHSVCACGGGAEEILADHDPGRPCGPDSPFARIAARGGRVLLVGVTHVANTLLHVAQCVAEVPYLDRFRDAPVVGGDGETRSVRVRRAGCSRGFDREGEALADALLAEGRCGDSRLLLFDGARLLEIATGILRRDPEALLCEIADCPSCAEARAMCREEGP